MKQLIRRISQVADSSGYILLRSDGRADHRRRSGFLVPEGHLPVYVGEEMERYVLSAKLLNHPHIARLLDMSAEEYGYKQPGGLRIPCSTVEFDRLLQAFRGGDDSLLNLHDHDELFSNTSSLPARSNSI